MMGKQSSAESFSLFHSIVEENMSVQVYLYYSAFLHVLAGVRRTIWENLAEDAGQRKCDEVSGRS